MRTATIAILALFALPLATTAKAQECENVGAQCSLTDLGSDQYEYTFTLVNGSPEANAIFFWLVDPPLVPAEWETIGFDLPGGWSANHPGPQLHFSASSNGSGTPERLYSPAASACGAGTAIFRWTFVNRGGPIPDCDLGVLDYTFHMQGVDPSTCDNVGDSFVCPGVVPVEDGSWGTIKDLYRHRD